MNARVEFILRHSRASCQPEEKELACLVKLNGGNKSLEESDQLLADLRDFEQGKAGHSDG